MIKKYLTNDNLIVFGATLAFLLAQFALRVPTDFVIHAHFVAQIASGEIIFPGNFLYYLLAYVLSLGAKNFMLIMGAAALIASFFVAVKYFLTKRMTFYMLDSTFSERQISWFCGAMLIVFSLPSIEYFSKNHFYLPQIPPNAWNNSTFIAMMPFAVALFWVSYQQLMATTQARVWTILVLVMLNIAIKPSFFMIFVTTFPIFLWFRQGFSKLFFWNLLPIFVGLVQLSIENQYIFHHPKSIYYFPSVETQAAVVIAPFHVWRMWSDNISLSIFTSSAFPLLCCIFYGKILFRKLPFQYIFSLYISALLIFILLTENNPNDYAGNFSNQTQVANYLFFWITGVFCLEQWKLSPKMDWKLRILSVIFGSHILSGIFYIGRFLIERTYK
ncbi:MAG: hypothetical protein RL757_1051 [Bacteroidota bacterium]